MSRASRKMSKRRKRAQAVSKKNQVKLGRAAEAQRQHMQELLDKEDYVGVLQGLADLVQAECYDTDMMYLGAYSYFMQGDYTRSASMLSSILTLAPQHLAARILLACICMLEDRADDGLAIFDFIAEHFAEQLTQKQREDIEDIADYYVQTEREHVLHDFPALAAFMGLIEEAQIEKAIPAVENDREVLPSTEKEAEQGEKQAEPAYIGGVSKEIASVMGQPIALTEKVRLLNAFAAAHFAAGSYLEAHQELEKALHIDEKSDMTIRNMAVLLKRQGDGERAVAVASQLSQPDFLLLDFLLNDEVGDAVRY